MNIDDFDFVPPSGGRKTETVKVPDFPGTSNRDRGKLFRIVEWPAARADEWVTRIFFAFNRAGGELPMDAKHLGMAGLAVLGINTFLRGNISADDMIPLLNQLLECVKIVRDPRHPDVATELVSDDDIQEVATRYWLRSEVIRVHTNFSPAAALSALVDSIMTPAPLAA